MFTHLKCAYELSFAPTQDGGLLDILILILIYFVLY